MAVGPRLVISKRDFLVRRKAPFFGTGYKGRVLVYSPPVDKTRGLDIDRCEAGGERRSKANQEPADVILQKLAGDRRNPRPLGRGGSQSPARARLITESSRLFACSTRL